MDEVVWYHGTRRGFTRGGIVMPRSFHKGTETTAPVNPGMQSDSENWAYVTTSLDLAWVYAFHAPGRGRPKVLVTKPLSRPQPDPEHSHETQAWRCEAATVTGVLLEPTMTEDEARTGWCN